MNDSEASALDIEGCSNLVRGTVTKRGECPHLVPGESSNSITTAATERNSTRPVLLNTQKRPIHILSINK
jgi:hypothetical protein